MEERTTNNYSYCKGKKVGVAGLKPTRYDNSKGNRIGPSLFYTSELQTKYIKLTEESTFYIIHINRILAFLNYVLCVTA